jgi:hypothetical protein
VSGRRQGKASGAAEQEAAAENIANYPAQRQIRQMKLDGTFVFAKRAEALLDPASVDERPLYDPDFDRRVDKRSSEVLADPLGVIDYDIRRNRAYVDLIRVSKEVFNVILDKTLAPDGPYGVLDHSRGKLMGVPMGVDVCYTNHAEADQDDMDTLLTLLGAAGVTYIMGVPGSDDVMLNYQSTSYHDALYLRNVLGLKRAPEFEAWLEKMQLVDGDGMLLPTRADCRLLAAAASL